MSNVSVTSAFPIGGAMNRSVVQLGSTFSSIMGKMAQQLKNISVQTVRLNGEQKQEKSVIKPLTSVVTYYHHMAQGIGDARAQLQHLNIASSFNVGIQASEGLQTSVHSLQQLLRDGGSGQLANMILGDQQPVLLQGLEEVSQGLDSWIKKEQQFSSDISEVTGAVSSNQQAFTSLGQSTKNLWGDLKQLFGMKKTSLLPQSAIASPNGTMASGGASADSQSTKPLAVNAAHLVNPLQNSLNISRQLRAAVGSLQTQLSQGQTGQLIYMLFGEKQSALIDGVNQAAEGLDHWINKQQQVVSAIQSLQKNLESSQKAFKAFGQSAQSAWQSLKSLPAGKIITGIKQLSTNLRSGQSALRSFGQSAQTAWQSLKNLRASGQTFRFKARSVVSNIGQHFRPNAHASKRAPSRSARLPFGSVLKSAGSSLGHLNGAIQSTQQLGRSVNDVVVALGGWKKLGIDVSGLMNNRLMQGTMAVVGSLIGIVQTASTLAEIVPALATAFEVFGGVFESIGVAAAANPIGAIVVAVAGLAAAGVELYRHWNVVVGWFSQKLQWFKTAFPKTLQVLKSIFDWSPIGLLMNHWKPLGHFFSNLWATIKAKAKGMIKSIGSLLNPLNWFKKLNPFSHHDKKQHSDAQDKNSHPQPKQLPHLKHKTLPHPMPYQGIAPVVHQKQAAAMASKHPAMALPQAQPGYGHQLIAQTSHHSQHMSVHHSVGEIHVHAAPGQSEVAIGQQVREQLQSHQQNALYDLPEVN